MTDNIDKIFDGYVNATKVFRDKLNHIDALMFLCDINTLKKQIEEDHENITKIWIDRIKELDEYIIMLKQDHEKEIKESFNKGYEKALDDHHILHGEDAKRFLKETGLDKLK